MFAANGNGGDYVVVVAWNYDADGNLTIIGTVGGVESAAAIVEADLAAKMAAEIGFKCGGVRAPRHE